MLHRAVKLLTRRTPRLLSRSAAESLDLSYGRQMLASFDAEERDSSDVEWKRHISHQKRRNWVFDDDDGDDVQPTLYGGDSGRNEGAANATTTDPMVGGTPRYGQSSLFAPSAAVLSPDAMFDAVLSNYSASIYAYGLFDVVDIVECLMLCGLLPEEQRSSNVGAAVETWFVSPAVAWRHRGLLAHLMGHERWHAVDAMLQWMLREYDLHGSPLKRASTSVTCNNDWCTFLRCSVACGLLSPDLAAFLPVVIEAAIKGNLVNYALPGDQRDRAFAVATLLLETSVEYGSQTLLDLALDVHRQFHLPTGYKVMLRVQQVFDKSGRRTKDWALRSSGALDSAIPKWLRAYYPVALAPLSIALRSEGSHAMGPFDGLTNGAVEPPSSHTGTSPLQRADDEQHIGRSGGGLAPAEATVWSREEIADLHRITTQDLLQGTAAMLSSHSDGSITSSPSTEGKWDDVAADGKKRVVGVLPAAVVRSCPMPSPAVSSAGNGWPQIPPTSTSSACTGVLYTDHIAPDTYFQSSPQRYGSGTESLKDSILRKEKSRMDLVRHGTALFAQSTAADGEASQMVGVGDNFGPPGSWHASSSAVHCNPLASVVLQQVLRAAEKHVSPPGSTPVL